MTTSKIYLNPGQQKVRAYAPNSKTIVASRRFGKSDGIVGPDLLRDIQHMPQGSGSLYQASYKQLLGRTLPSTLQFLDRLNYKADVHYFIGRKAPKFMNFKEPFIKPLSWEHVVHFYNGSIIHLLSQDVKFTANSLTLDWLKADEARSLKKEKLFEEAIPAVSGSPGKFKDVPWYKGITLVSDMPTSKQGMWVVDEKNKMLDPKNIKVKAVVEGLLFDRSLIYQKYGANLEHFPAAQNRIANINKELNYFRRYLYMYFEFDTIENIEIVGQEYIREQKRLLPPIIFYTSILNKLQRNDPSGFYANLKPSLHYYNKSNDSWLDNQRTHKGTLDMGALQKHTCLADGDIDITQPLSIACDYNANINWVITGQQQKGQMITLSSFFTKHEQKLRSVLRYWAEYYTDHPVKEVVYYFDTTALDSAYADEQTENFAEIVYNELTARGWYVHLVNTGKPWKHHIKHQYINDALTGIKYLFPQFNDQNNEFLLPAMEQAGVKIGSNGFQKNKSGEKIQETEDDPLELRTDGTDAWDTLFIGLNFFPFTPSVVSPASVVLRGQR
ncbi:MAG: hypothetical protein WCX31_04580 [Salinivirgaceae bacterium]|jgi:hypothetical protein